MSDLCVTCDLPFWDRNGPDCAKPDACNGCNSCRAFCYGASNNCAGQAVDWRARCLAAESALLHAEAKLAAAEAAVAAVAAVVAWLDEKPARRHFPACDEAGLRMIDALSSLPASERT